MRGNGRAVKEPRSMDVAGNFSDQVIGNAHADDAVQRCRGRNRRRSIRRVMGVGNILVDAMRPPVRPAIR